MVWRRTADGSSGLRSGRFRLSAELPGDAGLPGGGQQRRPVIGQLTVHHLIEEPVQHLPQRRAGEAQGQQVPPADCQLLQGKAGLLFQKPVQNLLPLLNLRLTAMVRRGLGQIVRPLQGQQQPQVLLPQSPESPPDPLSVRGMSRSCHSTSRTACSRNSLEHFRRRSMASARATLALAWP